MNVKYSFYDCGIWHIAIMFRSNGYTRVNKNLGLERNTGIFMQFQSVLCIRFIEHSLDRLKYKFISRGAILFVKIYENRLFRCTRHHVDRHLQSIFC